MRKNLQIIAFILAVAMQCSLLGACGQAGKENSAVANAAAGSEAESLVQTEPSAAETATPDTDEAVGAPDYAVPEASAEEPSAEEERPPLYPVVEGDPIELSVFINAPPILPVDFSEMAAIQTCMEQTNVTMNFTSISQDAYYEQFNLMLASGNYTDLVAIPEAFYPGGIEALVEDEICVDLTPYFETCLPDYYATAYAANDDYRALSTSDSGKVVTVWALSEEFTYGTVIRQDLLEQVGMEVPATYDELDAVLHAFRNQLGLTAPTVMTSNWANNFEFLSGGMGAAAYSSVGEIAWQINAETKKVEPTIASQGYKDYITMLSGWWADGLIGDVSLTTVADPTPLNQAIYSGQVGFWCGKRDSFNTTADELAPEGFDAVPIPDITKTGTEMIPYDRGGATKSNTGGLAVTSQCAYPEEAMKVLNWFWTDEGVTASNFGEEGFSFEYDENGEPQFTDVINNNPDYSAFEAMNIYLVFPDFPSYYPAQGIAMTFVCQKEVDAQTIWPSNRSSELKYYGTLTVDESQRYAEVVSDISTLISESVSGFVVGDTPMSQWDAFVETLENMGLPEITAIKQDAYDRYLAR